MAEVALGLAAFAGISGALAVGTIALGESLQEGSDQIGPRADTQPYLSGSEGRILPFVLGPNNRVGGIVIWLPSLVEVEDTETTGGGMFSSTSPESSQTTFQYLADVAIAFADGPIEEGVQQIFVNGDMVWAPTGTTSVNGTDITCTTNGWLGNILFNLGGVGGVFYSAPSGGTDLAQFRVGAQIQVSGFTTAANNGTFLITNVGSTSSGGTYIRVVGDFLASNEAAGDSVTLTQLQITLPNSFANSFVEYKGDGTNTVEPIIQARESEFNNQTGRTPQYNQTAYGVFQGLQVSPYGNRVPQITMNLSQATSLSVAEGVTKLMNRVGIPPEYLDLSDVEDIFIRGMVLDRSFSLEQALRPLLVAYDLVLQDRNRTTKLVKRYEADEVTVPEADFLRVQEVGPYQLIEPISDNLPRQVTVNYRDVNNDNQLASQGERRQNTEDGLDSEINLSIPLSLTAGEAKSIAYRELYRLWQRRRKFQFSLPPKWLEIQEGDVINTTVSGIDYRLIVVKLDVGANFQINIEAEVDLGDSPTITGQPPVQTDQVVDVPSPSWIP
jgi:hypothetical protein